MTRDELLAALVVERYATVTPPPPDRTRGGADPLDWDHWAGQPDDLPPMPAPCGAHCLCAGGDPCQA